MSHKALYMNIYNSFIHNCQNLEATEMSFSRWMNLKNYIQPDNGILCITKKKWVTKPWKDMEEPKVHIIKWKKPIWKGYILYDYNYMTFWKRQNYGDSENISGCQGFGGGVDRRIMEDF